MDSESLWPEIIFSEETMVAPVQIMREQADILSRRMNRQIIGRVRTQVEPEYNGSDYAMNVENTFELVVPELGDYALVLFHVTHEPQKLYPAWVNSPHVTMDSKSEFKIPAEGEVEFRQKLHRLLNNSEIVGVIQTLKAQVLSSPDARPPRRPARTSEAHKKVDEDILF